MKRELTKEDFHAAKYFWDMRFGPVWNWHELTDEHKESLANMVRDSNDLMEAIVWGLGQELKNERS